MEGINVWGILLGYLAVFVFGIALLVALGLMLAGQSKVAKFLFSGGFLLAAFVMAIAALSFLDLGPHPEVSVAEIAGASLIILLAGVGQFIAAFRGPRRHAATLTCALAALAIGTAAGMGGTDVMPFKLLGAAMVSILLVMASVVIALLPSFGEFPPAPPR